MAASSSAASESRVLTRVYDDSVHYARGNFRYDKVETIEGTTYFSACSPPLKKETTQRVMMLSDKSLKEFSEERVLRRVVPGRDGRQHISETSKYPYSIHAQLEMDFADGQYGGSGALIGPHHILTCGHNVYNTETGQWAENISVYPARNERRAPFGKVNVTKVYTFSDWTERGDRSFDMALLLLDRSVGKFTGWGGICSTQDESLAGAEFNITGYPGDKNFIEMWTMAHRIKKIEAEMLHYEIDTAGGQSGSAIWARRWGDVKIMGVHTLGGFDSNCGVRISPTKFIQLFKDVMTETYKLRKDPDLIPVQSSPIATSSKASPLPDIAYGKATWAKHGIETGPEPALPEGIETILSRPSPIAIEGYTGTIRETHLLVLIPETANGKPLTLNSLEDLFGKYKEYHSIIKKEIGAIPAPPSHWVLISKNVLEGTRYQTYAKQKEMVANAKEGYTLPNAVDIAAALLLHQKETGERLLRDSPWTYTRCQESVNNSKRPVAIGGFAAGGLDVSPFDDFIYCDYGGAVGARKFSGSRL